MSLFAVSAAGGDPPQRPVVTTVYGDNADLIRDVSRFYALDGLIVADVTYGQGGFWKKVDTRRFTLLGSDVDPSPQVLARVCGEAAQGHLWSAAAPVLRQDDFCALRYAAASIDVVVFDPAYLHNPGVTLAMNKQYNNHATTRGMYHRDILRDRYCRGMQEAWRVLRAGGMLWVKGKDEIESGTQYWSHAELRTAAERLGFQAHEQFILITPGGQLPHPGQRQHADKNHSFLWVCIRPASAPVPQRGRPKKGSVVATIKQQRGRRYWQDRLLRDHPAIYARYMAGELPSVHAAAKVAGLIKGR